jgi:hypothetical protein
MGNFALPVFIGFVIDDIRIGRFDRGMEYSL